MDHVPDVLGFADDEMARWLKAAGRTRARVDALLAFIAERGAAHPREVDAHFAQLFATLFEGGQAALKEAKRMVS